MGDFTEIAVNTTFPPLHDFFFSMPKSVFGELKAFLGKIWEVFGRFLGT